MKKLITVLVILLTKLIGCTNTAPVVKNKQERPIKPNIVIIYTDDQGYADVTAFGGKNLKTPNLDEMAKQGAMLTSFYVAQPVCSASRAALLTGSYPNRVGVHGAFMPNTGQGLNLEETTLAEMLKSEGYATAHIGKWHLGDDPIFMPNNQGFDQFYGIAHSNDMWPHHPQQGTRFNFGELKLYDNEKVVEVLDDQSDLTQKFTKKSVDFIHKNSQSPFFLYLAHPQPHVPLFASEKFKGSTGEGLYADVIAELDWSVGEILSAIKETGNDRNTLVIFTSDNGPWLSYGEHAGSTGSFREGKSTTFEGGVRTPFIIRWPTVISPSQSINTPIMNIDLLPTIAHLTGAELPARAIDGKNVWRILNGETLEAQQQAYFFYYGHNELQGVRYKNWKMYFPHQYQSLNNREAGINGTPVDYDQNTLLNIKLYNLNKDPEEKYDVSNENQKVVEKIKQLADDMRQDLGDSLLNINGNGRRELGEVSAITQPISK